MAHPDRAPPEPAGFLAPAWAAPGWAELALHRNLNLRLPSSGLSFAFRESSDLSHGITGQACDLDGDQHPKKKNYDTYGAVWFHVNFERLDSV